MNPADALKTIRARIDAAAHSRAVALVAASKAQPAAAIRILAAAGQRAFGENYGMAHDRAAAIQQVR